MGEELLKVRHLSTGFKTKKGILTAVKDVSFSVEKGEIFGIVGESGCGKTQTVLAIPGLLPAGGIVTEGTIEFEGEDLRCKNPEQLRMLRGDRIAMIFQDPMAALDPVYPCGFQMLEAVRVHRRMAKKEAKERCIAMLRDVGIHAPEKCMTAYPYELSGGMCQRVMIAMALLREPDLLIADEPTTALDVTVQAQILALLRELQRKREMSVILITHDLGVISEIADRSAVMYLGEIVEMAKTRTLMSYPSHPYTQGLIQSVPSLNQENDRLYMIQGVVPELSNRPLGCSFKDRCSYYSKQCDNKVEMREVTKGHWVRCVKA